MKAPSSEAVVMALLASVILAHLAVGLLAVGACLWHGNACMHVEWRNWFGEPLAAVMGLLGGRALERERML